MAAKSKRSSCGLYVKLCPENNSKLVKYPEFLNNCFLCLRCFAYCPKESINFKNYCSTSYRTVVVDEFLIRGLWPENIYLKLKL